MRLASFTVKNFRSITDAYKLRLRDFAVLVGPNNEGKSNILKAVVIALDLLSRSEFYRDQRQIRYRYGEERTLGYNWSRDFPVGLKSTQPTGRSVFALEFELTDKELTAFRTATKVNLASNLKLKLSCGREDAKFEVQLQGKAKQTLAQKREEVARFVGERLDIQYIPAIRPSDLAVEVVEELLSRELAQLEAQPTYQKLLTQLEAAQQPTLNALSEELTKTISSFVPEVKAIQLVTSNTLRRAVRRSCTVLVDDGTRTDLGMKGDGIKSLTAISLLRHTSQRALGDKSLILAIEEPESHLHPRAVHRLREVLQEIAKTHQVILTTHSPVLVDRQDSRRNIVVKDGRAVAAKHIREVRDALGVELADNLVSANLVLLVEGEEDARVLGSWLPTLSHKIHSALTNGSLVIDTLVGANNLKYKAGLHKTYLCNVHAFMDNDEAGRTAVNAAVQVGFLAQNEYQAAVCQGMQNSELEDLLNPSSYADALKKHFGVNLVDKFMSSNKKSWSDRIRENFENQGKPWSKQLERQVKYYVSLSAAAGGVDSLNVYHRGPIDTLVGQLEERLSAPA
jgi:predicted ATP-dependent endonuclease of OLD family